MLQYMKSQSSATVAEAISGKLLAHNGYGKTWRAFTAADLVLGRLHLVDPLATQAAILAQVSRAYAYQALAVSQDPDLRRKVEWGRLSLLDAERAQRLRNAAPNLVNALATATDDALALAGKVIGVDRVFDRLIAPNI
jgi:hypothetical protein